MRIRDWSSDVCSSDLLVAEFPVENLGKIGVRASAMTQRHRQLFGTSAETDKQHTFFAETSIAGESGPTNWLAGAAFQADLYRPRAFPGLDYSYTAPGLLGPIDQELKIGQSACRESGCP